MKRFAFASFGLNILFPQSANSRLILHVGPSKTGSSAIQEALNRERHQLSSHGIFYPEHQIDENMISSGHLASIMTFKGSCWVPSAKKILGIRRDFAISGADSIILTSEFFCDTDLLQALNNVFSVIIAVAYVRDPISLVSSEYIQTVKRANETQDIIIDEGFEPWFYHRLETCSNLEIPFEYFPYPNSLSEAESLATPILSLADYSGAPILCKRVNPRYTLEALMFKRAANHYLSATELARLDVLLQRAPLGCRDYNVLPADGQDRILDATCDYIATLRIRQRQSRLADAIEISIKRSLEVNNSQPRLEDITTNQMPEMIDYIGSMDEELLATLIQKFNLQPVLESVPKMFADAITTQV